MLDFGMDSSSELYDFCIQTTWVWSARVSLEIKLVPFFRVLLGIHPNSRFKGSLVENP